MQKLGHIAYNKSEGKTPTVIFLPGFRSDMEGSKALYIEALCRGLGQSFIRFDYSGHGKSGMNFRDCSITTWKNDTLNIIDELTTGEVILIGSSMGGWIMLLAALERKTRIKGLIGIAAAPDFTADLMMQYFNEEQKKQLITNGEILIPNCYDDQEPYPITKKLIDDGNKNLLLQKPIQLTCPVRLIHGMADNDVPYQTAARIAEKLESANVEIHLVKNGGHRMSEPENLELLKNQFLSILNS